VNLHRRAERPEQKAMPPHVFSICSQNQLKELHMSENVNGSALVMSAPEIPAQMKAVIARTNTALAEQQNVDRALQTARGALRQAEVEFADAQERLAMAESGAAVGAGDVDKNARKRLVAARDEVDFARARVAGLEEHLRVTTTAANGAQRDLAVEARHWTREQAATIVAEVYLPAINVVLDAMRLLVATGTALGVNRLLAIPAQAFICDPQDPVRNLASRKRLAWRDNPQAATTYERLSALMAVIRPLLGEFADGPIPRGTEDGDAAA
jgi:hypothetical protein